MVESGRGNVLGIGSAAQYWMEIVLPNAVRFRTHPAALEAFNICSSIWHQIDWIANDPSTNPTSETLTALRVKFEAECPSLSVFHDITTLSKHKVISRPRAGLVETKVEFLGATFHFGGEEPLSEHPSKYTVVLESGDEIDLGELVEAALRYWRAFFVGHSVGNAIPQESI